MSGYQLGGEFNLKTAGEIVLIDKGGYVGIRAFARAKGGMHREVFGVSSNTPMVDGCDQGGYFHHTHETKAKARTLASKAFRFLNR